MLRLPTVRPFRLPGRLRESQYLGLAEDEERRARKAQAVWGWPKDLGGRLEREGFKN